MQAEILLIFQLAVGLVFLLSGITKLADREAFSHGLNQYDILPSRLVRPIGELIIVGELAIAASHLSGRLLTAVVPIAVGLLLAFLFVVARAVRKGHHVPCLCFGVGSTELVSTRSLVRLALLVLAETGVWLSLSSGQRPRSWHELDAGDTIFVISAASLSLVALRWSFAIQDLFRLHKTPPMSRVCLSGLSKGLRIGGRT